MSTQKQHKEEKNFIKGRFFEYYPEKVSIWIPADEIRRIISPDGSIAFNVAKKTGGESKNTHYAWKSECKATQDGGQRYERTRSREDDMQADRARMQAPEAEGEMVF